ncbi:DoxX family protein [Halorarius halobius]|uniref:DoxX family protein n=1 Tax=Halorarius halobius TaxID=2962671 RepID=UPI0020CF0F43|nr:DoxX family membrane protein [Halorarius halobius]
MPADTDGTLARLERPLRYVMGLAYVVAGVLHFLAPRVYERTVPPELPRPRLLVYLSGVAEIVLGVGVLFERTRRPAAAGIVALLVAVFPANVNMAVRDVDLEWVEDVPDVALWARLPLQGVLALWAWWHAQTDP